MSLQTALTLNASGFNAGIDNAIKDTKDFQQAIGGASKETIKAFKDISQMGIGEMKKNLRELRNISFAGKSKEEIAAINKQIGILTDEFGDLRAMQKGMGTEFGDLAAKGVRGFAGMAEAGLGLAMVFGMDKKQAAEYQATMVGVMGAVQGLGEFQAMLGDKVLQSLVIRIKETVATAAQTVATWAATAAQWAYNASLLVVIGTIGAAVVVVAAITAGIYMLVGAHNDAREAAEKQGLAEYDLQRGLTKMKHDNEQMLKLAKARGASEKELKQLEIGSTNQYLLGLKKRLDAQLDLNGVRKEGVKDDERQAMLEEFTTASDAMDIMVVELGNLKDKTDKHTGAVKESTSALQKYIEEQNKIIANDKELAQFNVPNQSASAKFGQFGNVAVAKPNAVTAMSPLGEDQTAARQAYAEQLKDAKDFMNSLNDMFSQGMQSVAASFSQGIADMITGDGGFGGFFAGILSSVGSFLQQMGAAVVAYGITMEAFKKAFANPFAAIAAGIGLMIAGAVVKNYANQLQENKFANGGIVDGDSYSGDNVVARLNSGEMVLNQSQQGQLFAMANGGGGSGGEVVFRVEGTQLVGVLNNFGRKTKNTR